MTSIEGCHSLAGGVAPIPCVLLIRGHLPLLYVWFEGLPRVISGQDDHIYIASDYLLISSANVSHL